ncbi:valine--tRNA ligase [Candidatus Uhrbacteria bacterium]|nr:valine--tRNA ligase [Candidatus Uhrbacteria bacterium]
MLDFSELPKAYEAGKVEDEIYARWEASGIFNPDKLPDRNQKGEPYCIIMPPPNVTGVLHLGHALENALMDTMVRFQRMRGKKVLIIPSTDHAAMPTQAKVEKLLMQEGMKNPRQELGREKLVAKIREFAEQSKSTILGQIKKLGTSCDWSRLAYTFDDERGKAVHEMFFRLHKDGLIYRGYRVVNWSVKGQSTCSDDEVVMIERTTKLYTFKYGKDFPITIASTRPETKLGDTAVAVHPDDERYQSLIGKVYTVDVGAAKPLNIKIIADEHVDRHFGTGALGVTPAHSAVDFEMYEKQKTQGDPIDLIPVIGSDGKMTEEAGKYQGLTVDEAREKMVAWLKEQGLLEKEEEIVQNVGTSDRFGDVIEVIPMTQWWLNVNTIIPRRGKSLKDLMRDAMTIGLNGDIKQKISVAPERFAKLYLNRIENLRDWCLSRQIWWGHRIPVWYKDEETRVSETSPGTGWEQDPDTLDTWFSSGLLTFSTLGWPGETLDLKTFHPTGWITMGYEILYLWMMRMILMSAYVLDEIPFKDVYIHGLLRDEQGKKFSKSAGNNIDPLDVIREHGCDALRWSVLIGSAPGNDSKFYEEKVGGARNLVNKFWNISRFILMQIGQGGDGGSETLADQWILSRLNETVSSITKKLETYQFSSAGEELRDFTWGDLADWYLEIAKVEKGKEKILLHILQTILKLWHPFMPFVTEAVWSAAKFEGQLIVSEWPKIATSLAAPRNDEIKKIEQLRTLVIDLRRLRQEQGIEAAKQVEFVLIADSSIKQMIESNSAWIKRLINAETLTFSDTLPDGWATMVSGTITAALNVAGAIDVVKEGARLKKELAETVVYLSALEKKLENKDFMAKAPEKVVVDLKQKYSEAKHKEQMLSEQLDALS